MGGRLAGRVALVTVGGGELAVASARAMAAEGAAVVEDPDSDGIDLVHVTDPSDAAVATELAARLAGAGGGAIVLTASTRALAGDRDGTDDAVAGGGALALALALATRHGKQGVRVNAVVVPPPGLPTSSNLVPRAYRPEDAAAVAVFLVSDDAAFVTGQVVRCDGGLLAHLPHYASLVAAGTTTAAGR